MSADEVIKKLHREGYATNVNPDVAEYLLTNRIAERLGDAFVLSSNGRREVEARYGKGLPAVLFNALT